MNERCRVYDVLRARFNIKKPGCERAGGCAKRKSECQALKDIRAEELQAVYFSPEDISQNRFLAQLEQDALSSAQVQDPDSH